MVLGLKMGASTGGGGFWAKNGGENCEELQKSGGKLREMVGLCSGNGEK